MAIRQGSTIQRTLETIVAKPLLATLTVGTAILLLLQLINTLAAIEWQLGYLRFLMPFIPPFFITRTAKRVNQRHAEYDFIRDAEPYIFIAFPKQASVQSLLETSAEMISDSAVRHFNCSIEELLQLEALPARFFAEPTERELFVHKLIEAFQRSNGYGAIQNTYVSIRPQGQERAEPFWANSVLKQHNGKLKWQGTLMKQPS